MSRPSTTGFAVIDTTVFGAELSPTRTDLEDLYRPHTTGRALFISFMTAAELRFGARRAEWGGPRLTRLDHQLGLADIVWPHEPLIDAYVDLRVECARIGHGLAQKIHEADRWIAATALWLNLPLIAHDSVFIDAPGLSLVTELRS